MTDQSGETTTTDPAGGQPAPEPAGWAPPQYPGAAGPPGYGPPGPTPQYGYRWGPAPVVQHTDGFATASLVTSLIGLATCMLPLFPVLGVVFGHISLSRIKKSQGARRGHGMAVAGLTIGYISLTAAIGIWVAAIASDTTDTAPRPDPPVSIAEYGEDPTLDDLARQCAQRDFGACDDLWLQSAPGSGYESYGHSCGGRQGFEAGESATLHERCAELYG